MARREGRREGDGTHRRKHEQLGSTDFLESNAFESRGNISYCGTAPLHFNQIG
jgi:hypothetical protein